MKIRVSGFISVSDCDWRLIRDIQSALTLDNPQYRMAQAMAKKDPSKKRMLFSIKPTIKYYQKNADSLILPRGFAERLRQIIKTHKVKVTRSDNLRVSPKMSEPLEEKIELRDYQVGVVEGVASQSQGILELSTAFGKTIMAFRLAEITQLKTLIICCDSESNELVKYKNDFKKIYNKDIGVIQGKQYEIKDVTVCTMSTLQKRDLSLLANEFGLVIVDEIQKGMSERRREVLASLNPAKQFGMSATPGRSNGQSEAVKFTYGEVLIKKALPQIPPDIHTYVNINPVIGTEFYLMEEFASECEHRNALLIKIAKKYLAEGRKILILTKRTSHGEFLQSVLGKDYKVYALSSKDNAQYRSDLIQDLRSEKKLFDVLIGTYSLFSTGLDIPIIDTVFLGSSIKAEEDYAATLVQTIGRGMRLHDKKKSPLVIDIDDRSNKIMHRHFNSRIKQYKKREYKIHEKII